MNPPESAISNQKSTIQCPSTATGDQVDDYHGTLVPDPYRWLEDVDSPQTLEWIAAQNRLTFSFLESIPARDRLRQRLTALWDFSRLLAPLPRGERFFQLCNTGLQNQDVLYVMDQPGEKGRVLLDPNTLSEDGTVALTERSLSHDGNLLAYATASSGSDWLTWRVRRVDNGEDLPDVIQWSKFSSAAWLPDGSGFYYAGYDAPTSGEEYAGINLNQKLYLHCLGRTEDQDELIYARPDQPEWGLSPTVSDDGHYLIIAVWQGTDIRNRLFYIDLQSPSSIVELIPDLEAEYTFIDNDGPLCYFKTNLESPRGRVIAIDTNNPARENWRTVIPESSDTLELVRLYHNELIAVTMHDAHHVLLRYSLSGELLGEIKMPTLGSIYQLGDEWFLFGQREDKFLYFTFHSFVTPPTSYRYNFESGETDELYKPPIHFDFSPYITEQVFVTSKDGTRVPMFLVYRRDMQRNGKNPTLLYGYGGFNISMTPQFSISRLAWLELGGVLAYSCLRGGGEYGDEWHQAGMLANKQNVFDDFIACAEWLIAEEITSTPELAIQGRSNGGLLVGACLAQRPDLFGAALPGVGVMDMLRFHKFTIGWAWASDYGSSESPEQFKYLYAYSPLHNLKPGKRYPPTLITTADHDDRVVPGHSFKFAAALQAAQAGGAPVLIRIQTKAGHGFGKPTAILIQEEADNWAFLTKVLGI